MPTTATSRIEHLVVLMLENRSFDHIFGFRPGVNGLQGTESNLLNPAKDESSSNPAMKVSEGADFSISVGEGPSHSLQGVNVQIFNDRGGPSRASRAKNNGFVANYFQSLRRLTRTPDLDLVRGVMESFTAASLPTISALADNFVLCDNWYCEVPGPTMPNRMYIHAATSTGYAHNVWDHTFTNRTIYDNVAAAGRTWTTYDFDSNEVLQFASVRSQTANFKKFEDSFAADVAAAKLSNYSFIIPRFFNTHGAIVNSQHAPWDVRPGEHLIADVYEALRANDAVWQKSALIVTYDEHGGFYDHVIPPATGIPNPDNIDSPPPGDASFAPSFKFNRLGLRVPTIIASPWVAKGKVDSTRYQHTSVLATAKALFGLSNFLTKRDASANDFTSLFTELSSPRTDAPKKLPRPADVESILEFPGGPAADPGDAPLDELQKEMLLGIMRLTAGATESTEEAVTAVPDTQAAAAALIQQRIAARFGAK